MRLRFHPLARVEYMEAVVYLEQRRTGYGEKFEAEVEATLERVSSHRAGSGLPGTHRIDLRAFPMRLFRF